MPANVFRRAAKKSVVPAPPVIEGLVPIDDLPKARKPYGAKDAIIGAQGLVYTPTGLYSQIAESSPERLELDDEMSHIFLADADDIDAERRASKKQRQWRKWSEDIIPALLKPYMDLLLETDGLRDMNRINRKQGCKGCNLGRLLDVSCVFFGSRLFGIFD